MFTEDETECVGRFDEVKNKERNFDNMFYSQNTSLDDVLNDFFKRIKDMGIHCDYNSVRRYNFRNRVKPVYIEVRRANETKTSYEVEAYPFSIFIDTVLFPVVDRKVNNYWAWCAYHVKKLLKKQGIRGLVRITFYHDYDSRRFFGTHLANININLESEIPPHKEHRLWMN